MAKSPKATQLLPPTHDSNDDLPTAVLAKDVHAVKLCHPKATQLSPFIMDLRVLVPKHVCLSPTVVFSIDSLPMATFSSAPLFINALKPTATQLSLSLPNNALEPTPTDREPF